MKHDVQIRSDKKKPDRLKYPFGKLVNRGESFFLPEANTHNVRQSARSFERHHPEIAEAGDRLKVNMERENGVDGTGVYRVEKGE